VIGVLKG